MNLKLIFHYLTLKVFVNKLLLFLWHLLSHGCLINYSAITMGSISIGRQGWRWEMIGYLLSFWLYIFLNSKFYSYIPLFKTTLFFNATLKVSSSTADKLETWSVCSGRWKFPVIYYYLVKGKGLIVNIVFLKLGTGYIPSVFGLVTFDLILQFHRIISPT